MKQLKTFLLIFLITIPLFGQKHLEKELSGYVNPEELVTLSENIPFDKAIEMLSKISEKLTGQRIVSVAGVTEPIGIEITKMPYRKALLIIVQYKNLVYEEKPDVIIVKSKEDLSADLSDDIYASVTSREVKISAVFFEANITEMREEGINWELLFSKDGLSIGSNLKTFLVGKEDEEEGGQEVESPPDYQISTASSFDVGGFSGTALAAFKFFETNNLGEVIARPNITVRDGVKGRIQIGSDISIKQKDFAGNVTDVFVSTGTIIDVIPYIYTEEGIDYILLKLKLERSTGTPDIISTVINKTEAETEVLMLDGEETIIGGLFINDESYIRRGIPFLKDLPWWVFGIRYLAGYNQKLTTKKEVILLLKTEIVPTLAERVASIKEDKNLIKSEIEENTNYLNRYKVSKFTEVDKE